MREFFGDEPFLVMAGDALTDVDFAALARGSRGERRDRDAGREARRRTPASSASWSPAPDGRVQGFQEKPDPAEALSDRANCMIYAFDPEIFDHFPDKAAPDFALDIFPALLDADIPFYVHETDGYWNDVGSLPEYLSGNLDAVYGEVEVDLAGDLLSAGDGIAARRGRRARRAAFWSARAPRLATGRGSTGPA